MGQRVDLIGATRVVTDCIRSISTSLDCMQLSNDLHKQPSGSAGSEIKWMPKVCVFVCEFLRVFVYIYASFCALGMCLHTHVQMQCVHVTSL